MKLVLNRRRKTVCLLIASLMIVAISSPLIVEACKTKEKEDYDLDLSASVKLGTTITLRAKLILITETYLHRWISKSYPVNNAMIFFYTSDKNGHVGTYLGKVETNSKGIASFSLTLTHFGEYWYVAQFTSTNGKNFGSHS